MRQIMNSVPEGVLLLDNNGRILMANPTARHDLQLLANAKENDLLDALGDHSLDKLLEPPKPGLWHEVNAGDSTYEVVARSVDQGPEPDMFYSKATP